jgi:hypothetical protein
MTGLVIDRCRRAATYAVLIALAVAYAASLAIFARTDRRPAGVPRADVQSPLPIPLSQPVRIGDGGCAGCRRSGWAAPAQDWAWTIDDVATLAFAAPTARGLEARELVFDIDAGAFLPRGARRTLRVSIGGEVVGEVQFAATDPMNVAFFSGGHFVHSLPVPGRLVTAGPSVLIEFHMASIGSPRQYYLAADRRELGVAVRSVSFGIAP